LIGLSLLEEFILSGVGLLLSSVFCGSILEKHLVDLGLGCLGVKHLGCLNETAYKVRGGAVAGTVPGRLVSREGYVMSANGNASLVKVVRSVSGHV
jgi:hypothetical protein